MHVDVALRKPLEPAAPSTDDERALAALVRSEGRDRALVAPPVLAPDPRAVAALARAIAGEPRGLIVAGALPLGFADAREAVFELARRSGYPIVAEAGSQLRFGERPADVVFVDHFDLIPSDRAPAPSILVQLGCEPVAMAWPAFAARGAQRWILAGPSWRDPDSTANVILGDSAGAVAGLVNHLAEPTWLGWSGPTSAPTVRRAVERAAASLAWRGDWATAEDAATAAAELAIDAHTDGEHAAIAAALGALPDDALVQIGNSLPIRVVDHVGVAATCGVISQRGAAGIDGLVASAAGATRAGRPVLLVLGDVSFAHDLGGLLAARAASAPLAILVVDNGGGQIFAGLPVARAGLGDAIAHWLTPPAIDPAVVATALGARAVTAASPAAVARAVAAALATSGTTVIHAPVAATGAHDVRRDALQFHAEPALAQLGGQS